MIPEARQPDMLRQMIATGEVRPPAQQGMPDLIPELAPHIESIADLLIADRDRERNR
jgi:hypothetical protein